jgi:hypothetical protein
MNFIYVMCTQTLRRCGNCSEAAGQHFETVLWSWAKLKNKYRLQSPGRDMFLIRLSPATATVMRLVQAANVLPTTNFYVPWYALSCQSENQCPLRNCIILRAFQFHLAFKLAFNETCKQHSLQAWQVLYFTT